MNPPRWLTESHAAQYWDDPYAFKPERFMGKLNKDAFVPFSGVGGGVSDAGDSPPIQSQLEYLTAQKFRFFGRRTGMLTTLIQRYRWNLTLSSPENRSSSSRGGIPKLGEC